MYIKETIKHLLSDVAELKERCIFLEGKLEQQASDFSTKLSDLVEENRERLEAANEDTRKSLKDKIADARKRLEVKIEDARKRIEAKNEKHRKCLEAKLEEHQKRLEAKLEDNRIEIEAKNEDIRKLLQAKTDDIRKQLQARNKESRKRLEGASNETRKEFQATNEQSQKRLEGASNETRKQLGNEGNPKPRKIPKICPKLYSAVGAASDVTIQTGDTSSNTVKHTCKDQQKPGKASSFEAILEEFYKLNIPDGAFGSRTSQNVNTVSASSVNLDFELGPSLSLQPRNREPIVKSARKNCIESPTPVASGSREEAPHAEPAVEHERRNVPDVATIMQELEANECIVCGKTFRTQWYLRFHQQTSHKEIPSNVAKYKCKSCDSTFEIHRHLKKHIKKRHSGQVRSKLFGCQHCEKRFEKKSKLQVHERVHSGVRPFVCSNCKKSFKTMSHLTRHVKSHINSYLSCPTCRQKFQGAESLLRHRSKCLLENTS